MKCWKSIQINKEDTANKALHRSAIPLRSIAAGELGRSATREIETAWIRGSC